MLDTHIRFKLSNSETRRYAVDVVAQAVTQIAGPTDGAVVLGGRDGFSPAWAFDTTSTTAWAAPLAGGAVFNFPPISGGVSTSSLVLAPNDDPLGEVIFVDDNLGLRRYVGGELVVRTSVLGTPATAVAAGLTPTQLVLLARLGNGDLAWKAFDRDSMPATVAPNDWEPAPTTATVVNLGGGPDVVVQLASHGAALLRALRTDITVGMHRYNNGPRGFAAAQVGGVAGVRMPGGAGLDWNVPLLLRELAVVLTPGAAAGFLQDYTFAIIDEGSGEYIPELNFPAGVWADETITYNPLLEPPAPPVILPFWTNLTQCAEVLQ